MIFQRVRCYKRAHFFSDILCADGRTVRPDMLTNAEVHSRRVFSRERPTRGDFDLWCHALRSITSMQLTIEPPLGLYLVSPHNTDEWLATEDESSLFLKKEDGNVDVYTKSSNRRSTRRPHYDRTSSCTEVPDEANLKLASVLPTARADSVSLHSTAEKPQQPQACHQSVPELLKLTKNPSLWTKFKCNGNGWWI